MEILHVLLMEHFPLLDKKYHSRCVKASFQLFLSISPKSLTYVNSVGMYLVSFYFLFLGFSYCHFSVFQSLIRICAHPPAVLVTELLSEEGIANVSQTSCTDFLPLWLRMTSPEAFKDLGIFQLNYPDSSKTYVQEQFYSATIHSALKLIGRLNLAYSQVSYQDDSEDKEKEKLDADIQGSYKVDNLQDHRLLYSLEEFLKFVYLAITISAQYSIYLFFFISVTFF